MQNKRYSVFFNSLAQANTSLQMAVWAESEQHAICEATKLMARTVLRPADFIFAGVVEFPEREN